MATKIDKSELKKNQKKAVELLANPDFNGTITELCEQCGVVRSTFYKWMDKKAFTDYLNDQISKYSDSELSRVWKALIRKIEQGDVQAMKLYFEQRDKLVKVEVDEDSDGFLDALEKKAGDIEWE